MSGKPWKPELDAADHDYVVVPEQPWLDGFCVAKDVIRQFVAMPLGSGYSVEEQITGKPEHGGLQVLVYPMKKERYEPILKAREEARRRAQEEAQRSRGRVYCMAAPAAGASFSQEPLATVAVRGEGRFAAQHPGRWRSPPAAA